MENNMECKACGYESTYEDKKKEKFIHVNVVATIESSDREGFFYDKKVYIYACPKCGTLKIDTN